MTGRLMVFDFDYTLIDENSDTYVVFELSKDPEAAKHRLSQASKQNAWTRGMDTEMRVLAEEGRLLKDLETCLAEIKMEPEIRNAMKHLSSEGWDVRILSDANTWFIPVILKANGVMEYVKA
mmetsp:Transcript_25618/g.40135  ORF Transcript_25618/g.40135 Transcript_25618/m.40135 type:complete len:122 (+) Transcript_25618:307-672(+)